jgi:hypothetical protein
MRSAALACTARHGAGLRGARLESEGLQSGALADASGFGSGMGYEDRSCVEYAIRFSRRECKISFFECPQSAGAPRRDDVASTRDSPRGARHGYTRLEHDTRKSRIYHEEP